MEVKKLYDEWSSQYDGQVNKTRDLEAIAFHHAVGKIDFANCLEIGCGTGKNTNWLAQQNKKITAVDFSSKMLSIARKKIMDNHVRFVEADITKPWLFTDEKFDLVSFSLILEHIENLEPIFRQVKNVLLPGGHVYLGELHPFKQYAGTKARFTTEAGEKTLPCHVHHFSDFISAANNARFEMVEIAEYFDNDDRNNIPRILTMLLINS